MFAFEPIEQSLNIENKKRVSAAMASLVDVPVADLAEALEAAYHPHASWNGSHPLNERQGPAAIQGRVLEPLRRALPDVERRDDIVIGGRFAGSDWVGIVGNYVGTLVNDWFSIPATRGIVTIRYGEVHRVSDGKIDTSYVIIDFLDLMRQAGFWPIAPSLGREGRWLGPATQDGRLFDPQDPATSRATIDLVLQMHQGLFRYNRQPPTRSVLDEMEQATFWHPHMMWYGPAGIGSARGMRGFEDYHQIPFLIAFPNRRGASPGHYVRIGDGHYAVTGGWPSLVATHTGSDWLGLPATGRSVTMRVMDFYRCDGKTIVENWVPIDIIDVLRQLGVDVFGRMRAQFRQHQAVAVSAWMVGSA